MVHIYSESPSTGEKVVKRLECLQEGLETPEKEDEKVNNFVYNR